MKKIWRVGIVGAGVIGARRAQVATEHPRSVVVGVADVDLARAESVAKQTGARVVTDWKELIADSSVDIVVLATPTNAHAPAAVSALKHRKHVLCEKPLARTWREAQRMVQAAKASRFRLKTGFNLRYHPAIFEARELASAGEIGKLFLAKCTYGHGGRAGYEHEWRMDPKLSGGGELIDQGIHALDLFRWFLGDFQDAWGCVGTLYWPIGPVEDNAFAILRGRDGRIAQMHASWTQWKNRFRFEVFGEKGYLRVDGLGKSYGVERLTVGRRLRPGAVPEEEVREFPGPDVSWQREWDDFLGALEAGRQPMASGPDGLEALRLAEAVYRSSRTRRAVRLPSSHHAP